MELRQKELTEQWESQLRTESAVSSEAKADLETRSARIEELQEALSKCAGDLDTSKRESDKALAEKEASLNSSWQEKLESLRLSLEGDAARAAEEHLARIQELETSLLEYKAESEAHARRADNMELRQKELTEQWESQLRTESAVSSEAKADLETRSARIEELQEALSKCAGDLDTSKRESDKALAEKEASLNSSWQEKLESLRLSLEGDAAQAAERHSAHIQELETSLSTSAAEIEAKTRQLAEIESSLESLQTESKVESLRKEVQILTEQRCGLHRKLKDLQNKKDGSAMAVASALWYSKHGSTASADGTTTSSDAGGVLYMQKIEELEAENARLEYLAYNGATLYVPKIQELEGDLAELQREVETVLESQRALLQDSGQKSAVIRELLRRSGLTEKEGTAHRLWKGITGRASSQQHSNAYDHEVPPLRLQELESALNKALAELALRGPG